MTSRYFMMAALAAATAAPAAAQAVLDRHYLDTAEYFIARDSMRGPITWVAVARQMVGPTTTSRGEAQFLVTVGSPSLQVGQTIWTRYFWKTRPAAVTEASLGQRVFCSNRSAEQVYRAPASRDEALRSGWWSGIITDVSDAFRGEVRAGPYRANLSCLRVEDVPAAAALAMPTGPDRHFMEAEDYLVAPEELRWNGEYVAVGRVLVVPTTTSGGQGQFVIIGQGGGWSNGERAWTRYFYQTRPVDVKEIAVGMRVFCLDQSRDDVYRGPNDRTEALNSGWWATTITDVSNLFRGEVQAGTHRLSTGCLRVIR